MELLATACKPCEWRYDSRPMLLALLASKHDFDPTRENGGMLAMGLIVLVTWLAFRQMLRFAKKK
jgi:hypothetical protein